MRGQSLIGQNAGWIVPHEHVCWISERSSLKASRREGDDDIDERFIQLANMYARAGGLEPLPPQSTNGQVDGSRAQTDCVPPCHTIGVAAQEGPRLFNSVAISPKLVLPVE